MCLFYAFAMVCNYYPCFSLLFHGCSPRLCNASICPSHFLYTVLLLSVFFLEYLKRLWCFTLRVFYAFECDSFLKGTNSAGIVWKEHGKAWKSVVKYDEIRDIQRRNGKSMPKNKKVKSLFCAMCFPCFYYALPLFIMLFPYSFLSLCNTSVCSFQ